MVLPTGSEPLKVAWLTSRTYNIQFWNSKPLPSTAELNRDSSDKLP